MCLLSSNVKTGKKLTGKVASREMLTGSPGRLQVVIWCLETSSPFPTEDAGPTYLT